MELCMKRFLSGLIFFVFIALSLSAEILPVQDLSTIRQTLVNLDEETLLIFDIDETLIKFDDPLLRTCGKHILKKYVAQLASLPPERNPHHLSYGDIFSLVLTQAPCSLVDPTSPRMVQKAQWHGARTLALTAMPTGKIGVIEDMMEWRLAQLSAFGFDFSCTFPSLPPTDLPASDSPRAFPIPSGPPQFKAGVICCGGISKGEVLLSFLPLLNWTPKQVICLDDSKSQLDSLEKALGERGIPFIGYHYTATDALPCLIDEEVAQFQLRYLIEEQKWLTREEAEAKLHPPQTACEAA